MRHEAHTGWVTTEGETLFYEVRGPADGTPLLLIAPGGGDGWQYAWLADELADEYKVITYDRRANGRSTLHGPQNFTLGQQSRDAVAVLHAAGESSAYVFGNSSGAVIALELATSQPQAARAVVAHEAPLPRLLPDARKWQRFFAGVYLTAYRWGASLAALQFMLGAQLPVGALIKATKGVNQHQAQSAEPYLSARTATEVLVELELLPVTNYLPDVAVIKANGVPVVVGVGQWALAKQTWYVRAAQILAEMLGRPVVTFPGHHGAFMDQPSEFAAALRQVLQEMETVTV